MYRRRKPVEVRSMKYHPWKLAQEGLLVIVGIQQDGAVYQVYPTSEERIRQAFPQASVLRSVVLGHNRAADFDSVQPPLWERMVALLTGLNSEQIAELGGVRIYSPERDEILWERKPAPSPIKNGPGAPVASGQRPVAP